jgi:hypothetical protein
MKKILSILLIMIYGTATFGMSVKEFYCCGKLKSVSVSFNIFSKSKQTKDDGCCKTKYHSAKVKDNHIASDKVVFNAKKIVVAPVNFNILVPFVFANQKIVLSNEINGPPILYERVPVYILNCNYRI